MTEWQLLSVREAAARVGVDVNTVRLWIRKGAIRYYRVGPYGTIRINAEDIADIKPPEGRKEEKP